MTVGSGTMRLEPVRGRARIDVLDILRGIAILGIFYMNSPFMGLPVWVQQLDPRLVGWSSADRAVLGTIFVTWEGTQRGLLEFLFGAGMMVLSARAMTPDGPVAVADLYLRRNLWLLLFGLADVFLFLWPGDILHVYAIAALFLFPFRKLGPRALVALGLLFATVMAVQSGVQYASRTTLVAQVETAHAHQAARTPLTPADTKALAEWNKKLQRFKPDAKMRARIAEEQKVRTGGAGLFGYVGWVWQSWITFVGKGSTFFAVLEAFSAMLIGIALWKWGVIQGQRSTRFYVGLTLLAYGFGLSARWIGLGEVWSFSPMPKTYWITEEFARLAVSLGHVGLVNLLVRTRAGAAMLAPFKAAGRTAFSLYFLQQGVAMWILFNPFVGGLWAHGGHAWIAGIATIVIGVELVLANLWVRAFVNGPMEWAWRSLSYWQRQPFRRARAAQPFAPSPEMDPGPAVLPA